MPALTGLGEPRQGTHLSMLRTTHRRKSEGALLRSGCARPPPPPPLSARPTPPPRAPEGERDQPLLRDIPPGAIVAVLLVLIASQLFFAFLPYRRRAYL